MEENGRRTKDKTENANAAAASNEDVVHSLLHMRSRASYGLTLQTVEGLSLLQAWPTAKLPNINPLSCVKTMRRGGANQTCFRILAAT